MNLVKLLLEINKIGRQLSLKSQEDDLGLFLYEKINELLTINSLAIGELDFFNETINYRFLIVDGKANSNLNFELNKDTSLAYRAVIDDKIIVINNMDLEYKEYIKKRVYSKALEDPKSLLFIPIHNEEKVIGFLSIQDKSYNFFDEEKVLLLREVAKYLGMIMANLQREKKLTEAVELEQKQHREVLEDNEVLNYINNFIKDIMEDIGVDNITKIVIKSFEDLYGVGKIKIMLNRIWDNSQLIFKRDNDEEIKVEERSLGKEIEILDEKKVLKLSYNEEKIGLIEVYDNKEFDSSMVDETLKNLISLSYKNSMEKMQLEFEVEENRKLTDALQQSYSNLKEINAIGEKITSTLDLVEIGQRVYDSIMKIFEGDCTVGLAYHNMDKAMIEYEFLADYGSIVEPFSFSVEDRGSFASYAVRNNKLLVINDIEREGVRYIEDLELSLVGTEYTQSMIFIPLSYRQEIIGVFTFQKKEKGFMDNYTLGVLFNISSFLAIALGNAVEAKKLSEEVLERRRVEEKLKKANKVLRKLSNEDSLTGLFNRRQFELTLEGMWNRAKLEEEKLSLLIIDIDYFKEVNDTLGHLIGDNYLVQVAEILQGQVIDGVRFGRYGGDEFIGLFYGAMAVKVEEIAETILDEVNNLALDNPKAQSKKLTLTIGLTTLVPNDSLVIDDFFREADRALYIGKEQGRNRIIRF